jgi:hypothetical protein
MTLAVVHILLKVVLEEAGDRKLVATWDLTRRKKHGFLMRTRVDMEVTKGSGDETWAIVRMAVVEVMGMRHRILGQDRLARELAE